ncbi:uroporphyrinogen-III C-methyltransferase [uncultured Paraglaciecola sp.]|uniref:uroporphyrinogen-III C-methyltransferase n=1 Tax=uncultured Paraglaciecola sp. TaxID=1765024 RepID=UPI0025F75EEA|nr:uroporphyrinogen-III C-methyltransferase [uncultured Paraglaciecola sp.]
MADSQDKLTPSNEAKLTELKKQELVKQQSEKQQSEKQLPKEKTASTSEKKEQAVASTSKKVDKVATKIGDTSVKETSYKSDKNTAASPPRNPTNGTTGKTGVLWFFTVINLLVLMVIIGTAYWAWLQWQTQSQQQATVLAAQQTSMDQQQTSMLEQQDDIAESIAANQLAKGDLEQQNQAIQTSIVSLIEQLQLTSEQVQTNQNNLADVSGRRPADWLLAEADYLIRMAGRKLWLEHDVKTAIMMLQSADSRIQDLDDPSLLPIRERLAVDLQNLQQVNQVSTSSIALALGAMLKQVDNLPLVFFKRPDAELVDETVTDSIDDWRSNFARNWQEATKNFFSFKKVITEIKPFMTEQQQWLTKEQLKFALMQAQIAALKENTTLYQQSLQTAFRLLIESFDTEKDKVSQFTNSLSNLQQTEFEQSYPEQFNVSAPLQDVIEQRLDRRFVNGNN